MLKAIQHIDITAEILTPPSSLHQQLSFTTINSTLSGETPQSRTGGKLFVTDKQKWYGK